MSHRSAGSCLSNPCLSNRNGAALVAGILMVPVMLVLAGLGIESGMARVHQSRIQNTLDASSIAGIQLARQDGMSQQNASRLSSRLGAFNLAANGVPSGRVEVRFEQVPFGDNGGSTTGAIATISDSIYRGILGDLTPNIKWLLRTPRSVAIRPPQDLCLVIDTGKNMDLVWQDSQQHDSIKKIAYAVRWSKEFAGRLDPGADRIAIVLYNHDVTVARPLASFTSHAQIDAQIELMIPELYGNVNSATMNAQRSNLAEGIATARHLLNAGRNDDEENRVRQITLIAGGDPDVIKADFVNPRAVSPAANPRWYPWNIRDRYDMIFPDSPFAALPDFDLLPRNGNPDTQLWRGLVWGWAPNAPEEQREAAYLTSERERLKARWEPLKFSDPANHPVYYRDATPRRVYAVMDNGFSLYEKRTGSGYYYTEHMSSNCVADVPTNSDVFKNFRSKYRASTNAQWVGGRLELNPPDQSNEFLPFIIDLLELYDTGKGKHPKFQPAPMHHPVMAPKDNADCLDNMGIRDSAGETHFDLWGEIGAEHQGVAAERFGPDRIKPVPWLGENGGSLPEARHEVQGLTYQHGYMGFKPYPALWDISTLFYYLPIVESDHAKALDGDNIKFNVIYLSTGRYKTGTGTDWKCSSKVPNWPVTDGVPYKDPVCENNDGYNNFYGKISNDPRIRTGSGELVFKDVYRFSSEVSDPALLDPGSNYREDQTKGLYAFTERLTEEMIGLFEDSVKVRLIE